MKNSEDGHPYNTLFQLGVLPGDLFYSQSGLKVMYFRDNYLVYLRGRLLAVFKTPEQFFRKLDVYLKMAEQSYFFC